MRPIAAFALLHFFNDAISGLLIGSASTMSTSDFQIALAILIYNGVAFGGQWFFAHYVKALRSPRFWIISALSLLLLAILIFPVVWKLSILFIGISSAIVHVEGATAVYRISPTGKALGWFAAPGILGLILGGWISTLHQPVWWLFAIPGLLLIIFFSHYKAGNQVDNIQKTSPGTIDGHDVWMVVLLSAIALRSAVWNVFQLLEHNNYEALGYIAIAAAAGKIAGGHISDRIGMRNYNLIALITSLPLLTIMRQHFAAFLAGIFLMQSTFGPTARMMMQKFAATPASGAANAFGTPLIIGGILYLTPWSVWLCSEQGVLLLISSSILLLYFEKRKSNQRFAHEKSRLGETAL